MWKSSKTRQKWRVGLAHTRLVSETPAVNERIKDLARPIHEGERKELARDGDDLPVVARMVVEIRSDGTRTIARGAAEDAATGEKVAIQIEGTTPLALALSIVKTLRDVPALARQAMKSLKK